MNLREAATMASIPYTTAARWVQQGIIRPENYVGRQRVPVPLSAKEARELCILARLRERFSLQELRQALKFLRKLGFNPLSSGKFLVVEGSPGQQRLVKMCKDRKEAVEVLGRGRGQLLLIPLVEDDETRGGKRL